MVHFYEYIIILLFILVVITILYIVSIRKRRIWYIQKHFKNSNLVDILLKKFGEENLFSILEYPELEEMLGDIALSAKNKIIYSYKEHLDNSQFGITNVSNLVNLVIYEKIYKRCFEILKIELV